MIIGLTSGSYIQACRAFLGPKCQSQDLPQRRTSEPNLLGLRPNNIIRFVSLRRVATKLPAMA